MLWVSLRTGFGNTAFVVALALLPLIAMADSTTRPEPARVEKAVAGDERAVLEAQLIRHRVD